VANGRVLIWILLCVVLCVLCVSAVNGHRNLHRRDAEDTEIAQRLSNAIRLV